MKGDLPIPIPLRLHDMYKEKRHLHIPAVAFAEKKDRGKNGILPK
jgi:hypothetical protein